MTDKVAKPLWTLALALATAACGGDEETPALTNDGPAMDSAAMPAADPAAGGAARAEMADAQGNPVGTAELMEGADGTTIRVSLTGLPAGEHGIHVHGTGRCDAPTFETAGSHLNPTNMQHGFDNPQGPHAGDLRNITVADDGTVTGELTATGTQMAALFDADGSAIVVHATADDYRTDPSGNSGDRIACGVVTRS